MPDERFPTAAELLKRVHEMSKGGTVMKIIVNGEAIDWTHDSIAYADVLRVALHGPAAGQYTVTFHNANGAETDGTMATGDAVRVKEGTVFNVTRTGAA